MEKRNFEISPRIGRIIGHFSPFQPISAWPAPASAE